MRYFVFMSLIMIFPDASFKDAQLKNSRVKVAYDEKEKNVKSYFITKNVSFTGFHLFIRAFKKEENLEVWIVLTPYKTGQESGNRFITVKLGNYVKSKKIIHT